VVKFFNNHHAPKAQLKAALSAAKLKMLGQMAPTRWGSIKKMAETMLAAEAILQQLVTARDFASGNAKQKRIRQAVHDTVTSKDFDDLLKMTLSILNPIDIAITCYQTDSVPISDVFATFSNELPRSITALTTNTDEERIARVSNHASTAAVLRHYLDPLVPPTTAAQVFFHRFVPDALSLLCRFHRSRCLLPLLARPLALSATAVRLCILDSTARRRSSPAPIRLYI
jgi:hypothetical protein